MQSSTIEVWTLNKSRVEEGKEISLGEITESYLEQVVFDLGTEGWIGFFLMEVEEEEVNSKLKVQWRKETGVVKHWGST